MSGPNPTRKENTMPETITREQLNEAINEFADKIMEALGVTVAGEETVEPELSGTRFKVLNADGTVEGVDAVNINPGSVVAVGAIEYFRYFSDDGTDQWVRYSGEMYNHEEFAAEMRAVPMTPRIIHEG